MSAIAFMPHMLKPGVIELTDKWPQLRCTATNIFLVVSMIWFSYTDKLYLKIMGYPWEIDWNLHHQYFLYLKFKENKENDMPTHAIFFNFNWKEKKISFSELAGVPRILRMFWKMRIGSGFYISDPNGMDWIGYVFSRQLINWTHDFEIIQ